jgi:cation diffusion facilitator CzcD-associated flavoprotein CzcO
VKPRACIIGAGSSGLAAGKALKDAGIPYDCYERSDRVGGLWVFENPSGTAAAYRNLSSNAPKSVMGYAEYPMPASMPDYPSHWDFARYFNDYADHFGLRERIRFETGVERVRRRDDGVFEVSLEDGSTEEYDCVLVANGHHWNPSLPEFEGEFDGLLMHSRDYRDAAFTRGKRVVVVGIGNSAVDIATETCHIADVTYLSVRRGAHVMPKFFFGIAPPKWLIDAASLKIGRRALGAMVHLASGRVEDYGLPKPDHKFGDAHPTMSAGLMDELRLGRIKPKPQIAELLGDRVRFSDGTIENVDVIICATGYQITFPFFDADYIAAPGNELRLYQRLVLPDRPGVFFIGLCQPLGAIQPIAEAQAKLVAQLIAGRGALPSPAAMRRAVEGEYREMERRWVKSSRHTIQIDHRAYLNRLAREMRTAANRPLTGEHLIAARAASTDYAGAGSAPSPI